MKTRVVEEKEYAQKKVVNSNPFVPHASIVRKIWGKGDTILLIFAGSAAEFALHKTVDWLYYTGKLPADPLGRLFSTVAYAQRIIFSDQDTATNAITEIRKIHSSVEQARTQHIPDWAYLDVLSMLIDYSIRAFELTEEKMTLTQKEDVYSVFFRMGQLMHIKDLPSNFIEWQEQRQLAIHQHLVFSGYTKDLYRQYHKHLGRWRYWLLLRIQVMLIPDPIRKMIGLKKDGFTRIALWFYLLFRPYRWMQQVRLQMMPIAFRQQIRGLDQLSKTI